MFPFGLLSELKPASDLVVLVVAGMVAIARAIAYDPEVLMTKLRRDVEMAVHAGRMEDQQAGRLLKFYEEALMGYTYLEDPNAD